MPDFAILPDTFMKFRRLLWKEEVSSQSTSLKDKKMAISFLSRKKKKKYITFDLESLYLAKHFLRFKNAFASQLG